MENSINTKLNYSLESTPWYFGAYLNMARHNLFLLINHLTDKFSYLNFVKLSDDEDIARDNHILMQIFDPKKKELETERFKVYKYLVKRHYLPLIKIFHETHGNKLDENPKVDYEKLQKCLQSFFELVNDFRNSYSHYLAIDETGIRIESRNQSVTLEIKSLLEELFNLAPMFSRQRFSQFQEEDFQHLQKYTLFERDSLELTGQGFYFFICFFIERKYAFKFLKKIKGYKNETLPSFKATLETFTAYSLKVPDVRLYNEDRRNELLLDILNELHRCPKELYNHLTDENKKLFNPQLDEDSIQNILKNEDYEDIADKTIYNILEQLSSHKRHQDRFPYYALRYIEEFNLLPKIRFQIEVGKLNIKSYKKVIDKVCVNRSIHKTIKKFGNLSDFEDKEDLIKERLKTDFSDHLVYFDQYAPHYNFYSNKIPFCLFESEDSSNDDAWKIKNPIGFISVNDLPKLLLLAYLGKNEKKNPVEDALINYIKLNQDFLFNINKLNEVKNKLVLSPKNFTKRAIDVKTFKNRNGTIEYLNNARIDKLLVKLGLSKDDLVKLNKNEIKARCCKNNKNLEYARQIQYHSYLEQRREALQEHLSNGLLANELPERVYNYLLNISKSDTSKRIHVKIKNIKEDCKLKIKQLKKALEKNSDEQNLKCGTIATFIARDIIEMVIDIEVKKRITSPYYNALQNRIAYFSISQNSIINLCNELELFNTQKGHAFLKIDMILKSNGVLQFFENYLNAKIKWIDEDLFDKQINRFRIPEKERLNRLPYSIRKIKEDIEDDDFKIWMNNKAKMPINFPNSLFDKPLKDRLQSQLRNRKLQYRNTEKFSVLLARLFESNTQPFYNLPRQYNIDGMIKEFGVNELDSKSLKKNYGKYIEKNEKKLRFIQTQDRILMLLCNEILSQEGNYAYNNLKLEDIVPFSESSPLNNPFSFKQKIIRKGNDSFFIVVGKDLDEHIKQIEYYKQLKNDKEREKYEGIKGYSWTLKNFGRFKRLVSDRRIPNLSKYFTSKEVPYEFIDYQLEEYDKYRERIFQKTFELEKYLADYYFEDLFKIKLEKQTCQFNEVQFCIYCKFLKRNKILEVEDIKFLKDTRNKFSHSEFPDKILDLNIITNDDIVKFDNARLKKGEVEQLDLSVCKKVYEQYEKTFNNIIANLKV